MIGALLTMTALAGSPDAIGLSWGQPYVRTDPILFKAGTDSVSAWGPTTTWSHEEPNEWHMYGGAVLELQWNTHKNREVGWMTSMGFRTFDADWTFGPLDFSASVVDVFATADAIQYLQRDKRESVAIRGYAVGGAGLQVSTMTPTYWQTHITIAPRVEAGLGVLFGRGTVRVPVDMRLQLATRADHYLGHVEVDGGAIEWRYFPGSSALTLNMGLQWWKPGKPASETQLPPASSP